jgi:hypothetical protein
MMSKEIKAQAHSAGAMTDLWQSYALESERQRKRISRVRVEFNKIPNAQYSASGYQLRSKLSLMYRQLEELRETERMLRVYYRFSGKRLRESCVCRSTGAGNEESESAGSKLSRAG